jgi:CSLREA domain-containing protein
MSRGNRGILGRNLTAALVAIVAILVAGIAHATNYVVGTLADTNGDPKCSLRDAINAANGTPTPGSGCSQPRTGNDTITFSVVGQIALTSAFNVIFDKNLAITGPKTPPGITLDGDDSFAVLAPGGSTTLNVNYLTIADGNSEFGGGINDHLGGTLNVANCTLSSNTATLSGGAIFAIGALTVTNSTFYKNSASQGGAIFNQASATAVISNSTFFDNIATNSVVGGGAIATVGPMNIAGNIFAMSTGDNCLNPRKNLSDLGYNIADDTTCALIVAPSGTSQIITPTSGIGLASGLGANGGPTETIALTSTSSPAVNKIPKAACPDFDQRGFVRPAPGQSNCDIGAFELNAVPPIDCSKAFASNANLTAVLPVFYSEYVFGVNNNARAYNLQITGVTQDKPVPGFPLCPNAFWSGTTTYVRATTEPLQPGPSSLLYQIEFSATDANSGSRCTGAVPVCVQDIFHSGEPCLASPGVSYDATKCPK